MKSLAFAASLIGLSALHTPLHARPMVAQDLLEIEQVAGISIAPDGQRVAIAVSSLPDIHKGAKNKGPQTQLKLATTPGDARQFIPDGMNVSHIKFSPDGRMIGFLWEEDTKGAKKALYGIPVGGGGHQKLASLDDAPVRDYVWGADSGSAYLLAGAPEDKQRKAEDKAGFDAVIYEEEQRFSRLLRAQNLGAKKAKITPLKIAGEPSALRLSRGGDMLAVAIAPSTKIDDSFTSIRVHLINAKSGKQKLVINTPGKIGDFEFSPDGKALSLIAAVDKHDPAATTLHLVDTNNGRHRALNAGATEAAMDAEWLSDGSLAAIIHKGVQSELRFYSADGAVSRSIDPGALILRSMETNGQQIAIIADTPRHPRELYRLTGSNFTRWTNSNPWLAKIDFGRQRAFAYTARDGQPIEGVLVEPVGGLPQGGAPTIFDVHGGPEAHDSNGWSTNYGGPGQIAAGKGYAVFQPNYRGSTGYGTAFSKQHQNDYAGKEFNDLVDAIAPLAKAGVTDKKRVGITGGSYGGYASGWAATALSKHFTAAVMFVGISNQISKFGTTDIPQEMYLVHSRKWPWEDWQAMLEVSPIFHLDKANTPILILHGAEDTRVAPSQSYELYRNLKVRKPSVPSRLVLYPGEGHGNRKAAARFDYNRRMIRWFDTYLKPGKRSGVLPAERIQLPKSFTAEKDDDEK